MNTIKNTYRTLDRLQRRRWFRIGATVVLLALCAAFFGRVIVATASIDGQRQKIMEAITGQNRNAGDVHAVTLNETGTVTVDGRTYGGERFFNNRELLFDESGTVAVPGALSAAMVRDQYPSGVPRWLMEHTGTTWMLAAIFTAWLTLIVWMNITVPFLLTLAGTAAVVGLARLLGWDDAVWSLAGIGLLTFTFVLLTRFALIVTDRSTPILAVAHTVIKEASRTKLSLIFVIVILILLPLLPLWLDPEAPLRFRLQTFISRGLGFTFYLAAFLTMFLSCATVAFEIRDRQIWQTLTKPVSRLSYLLGKWLGVVIVNLVILSISSVSIFTFIQYLREQPVAQGERGFHDDQQVRDAVLTARVGGQPRYDVLSSEQLRSRIDEQIRIRQSLAEMERIPVAVRQKMRAEIEKAYEVGQRTVPPMSEREYVFENLHEARRDGSNLTLRYRFHIMQDDEHATFPAVFYFNNNPNIAVQRTYVPTLSHVLSIPAQHIREDGTLSISIVNMYQPPNQRGGALNFEKKDFELLHKVGSFEANYVRAIFVDWVKLSFLAMLGISCATFLSFPVACLMSITIFVAGTIGPFLARSLEEYAILPVESVDWADVAMVVRWLFRSSIRMIGLGIVFLLESFGQARPTQMLVEGRLIAWSAVAAGTLKVGIVWSGISLLIGYLAMRNRQVAIYSGQG